MTATNLTRFLVLLGKGMKEIKVYPLCETKSQAEERAVFLYPGFSVISCEPYRKDESTWTI